MREIGVRELKARLSEALRDVGAGERIRVTSRGKPVADLVPPDRTTTERHWDALVASGRVTPASRPWPPEPSPPPIVPKGRTASEILQEDRDAER